MGKIRVKSFGSEEDEKKQADEAKKRREAKKIEAEKKAGQAAKEAASEEVTTSPQAPEDEVKEKKPKAKKSQHKKQTRVRSQKYQKSITQIDRNKLYSLTEAVGILPKLQRASFDETVELHINTISTGIAGNVTLPHGTGKQMKVEILNPTEDAKHVDDVIQKIEAGTIDFDVLIATPDAMPRLARVAKFLGPRGLMPNPKTGTVTPKPEELAKKYAGGQINFKTEAKFPLLHVTVGKVSFGDKKLVENITSYLKAIKTTNIKSVTLKSTMSPGIKVDFSA